MAVLVIEPASVAFVIDGEVIVAVPIDGDVIVLFVNVWLSVVPTMAPDTPWVAVRAACVEIPPVVNAVVAICVVFVPAVAVGAVGAPVRDGLAIGAYVDAAVAIVKYN